MIAIDEKKWCPTCKRWVLFLQAPDACYCYRCDSRVRCLKFTKQHPTKSPTVG